mgnify:CR=1 FL=1
MKSTQPIPKSKSQLAIALSKLAVFEKPQLMKEQYATDSEAAAEAVWFAYMRGDVKDKVVADLGCGTGLLGIAALLLGAEKVYFVDSDKAALAIAEKNISAAADNAQVERTASVVTDAHRPKVDGPVVDSSTGPSRRTSTWATAAKAVLVNEDVRNFKKTVDTVIQNPPFGTKQKHADRQFLATAFKAAGIVYSFHKAETADFVKRFAAENSFRVTNIVPLQLQLKPTYEFHRSRIRRVSVGFFRIDRKPFK